jgi:mono/diheme cytochrome c family protein
MMKVFSVAVAVWTAAYAVSLFGQAKPAAPSQSTPVLNSAADSQALVKRYCVTCHNDRAKAGGLTLTTADMSALPQHAELWEKVVKKLRAGLMPPAGAPRPDAATYRALTAWIEAEIDRAAAARPDPGRTEPAHRLNRAEYQNAIRDLLGVEMDIASQLPADDSSYGFDNIAGVLRMSPTLMERYLSVVRKVTRVAIGTPPPFPNFDVFRPADDAPQNDRLEGLPFGTRGGMAVRYNFPADGEYHIRVRLARQTGAQDLDVPRYHQPQQLEVSLDGEPLKVFTLPASEPMEGDEDEETGSRRRSAQTTPPASPAAAPPAAAAPEPGVAPALGDSPAPARRRSDINKRQALDDSWEFRFYAKAGPRDLVVTFLTRAPALLETLVEPYERPWNVGSNQWSSRRGAYLRSIEIGGPIEIKGVSETPSRRRILTCRPASAADEIACAKQILTPIVRRAYRRPATEADINKLLPFFKEGREDGFDAGIEFALQRVLMSPEFLFRIEADPPSVPPNTPYRISDLDLASRLSFFLWSSIPDDELIAVAARGKLADRAELNRQVRRMLADNRAQALVSNFAGQWLHLRNVPALTRDPEKDPDFDDALRQAFRRETEMFFGYLLRENRSVLETLTADYTFVNERLARHYGIRGVAGAHFRRVTYPDDTRRGLLGHGSVLSVTSYPNRTSPVIRGKWILENLLGTPPPAPPPNVPDLKEPEAHAEKTTLRQRIEAHRANPTCASCHKLMDPLGFALEGFDASGRVRQVDETFSEIDTSGIFPDGTAINGPRGLRQALLNHADGLVNTVVEKLLTYALGRGIDHSDAPHVRAITRATAPVNHQLADIVLAVVNSTPFQMRRSGS